MSQPSLTPSEELEAIRLAKRAQRRAWARVAVSLLWVYGLFAFAQHGRHAGESWGWLVLNVPLFLLASALAVVLHEGGHALAAALMRMKVFWVIVGTGPPLWHGLVRGRLWTLNALPVGGGTVFGRAEESWVRTRLMVATAAGPLANLLIVFAVRRFIGASHFLHYLSAQHLWEKPAFLEALTFWSAVGLANLLPMKVRTVFGEKTPTDGYRLLTTPFLKGAKLRELSAQYFVLEGSILLQQKRTEEALAVFEEGFARHPQSAHVRLSLSAGLSMSGSFARARDVLLPLLGQAELPAGQLAVVRNNFAWASLMLMDPELLPAASRASQQALAAAPNVSAFKGTRGAVLVLEGELETGLELLRQARQGNTQPEHKGLNACWIAIAEAKLGRAEQARATLAEAEQLGADRWALEVARKALDGAPDRSGAA